MATPVMYDQEVIVPSVDELKIETGGSICHVEGCGGVFSSSSQLHMHLAKHHRRKPLLLRKGNSLYCCPVSGCERSKEGKGKPFPRLGQLKQVCVCVCSVYVHAVINSTFVGFLI